MSDTGADDQLRVGNPERERAVALLNDGLTQGYLEIHEFDDRCAIVYAARTRGELSQALADLPGNERLFPERLLPLGSGDSAASAPLQLDIAWTTVTRKGAWQVPPRVLITGSMGKADLDLSLAEFSHSLVEIELQVSTSTIKLLLGADQSIQTSDVACGSWSTVKDQTGPSGTSTGPMIRLHGSLNSWSTAVIRRA